MAKQIGLFGFGVVGQGYYSIAKKHQQNLLPKTIVVQNKKKERNPELSFSFDPNDILDSNYDIGLELISDPEEAYHIVSTLLKSGKKVVSANKKMLAAHLPEFLQLEKEFGGSLLYEAAAAAGIPIITTLDTHFAGDQIEKLEGILNGSSNYILSQLFEEGLTFEEALKLAQDNGFAEADPTLDINGSDVSSKLAILILHAFGKFVPEKDIPTLGVQHIRKEDVILAQKLGLKIKLIAKAQITADGITAFILPSLVNPKNALYWVENEYNSVKIISRNLGEQFYKGKGAGSLPTGASVYADLTKSERGYSYSYDKLNGELPKTFQPKSGNLEVIVRAHSENAIKSLVPEAEIVFNQEAYWSVATISAQLLQEKQTLIQEEEISIVALNETATKKDVLQALKEEVKVTISLN
ncbi:homoserine dehydrogenase [Echinicola sp. CAU 1574]|uniref:Homoserine dehydrogenase n=1 Tax=Echinicola arenosa TaxID=2774144 RepID=A0ABR9APM2_9BACT|nr:homoserine dehydrogenase [Echinicola arenosa]MBD8490732.1 homoserine dehydrogenase [Echinicola arenosa]